MHHPLLFLLVAAALAVLPPAAPAADATAGGPRLESVQIGFDGVCKVGHWTPIWITVSGLQDARSARLELTTVDGEGADVTYRDEGEPHATPQPDGRTKLLHYVKLGRRGVPLHVRLTDGQRTLAERRFESHELPRPLLATQELILLLGPSIGEQEAVRRKLRDEAQRVTICPLADAAELPRRWYGYEGVSLVIAATGESSLLENMDGQQFAAFCQWLKLGGRLLWSAGQRGEELLASGSRLLPLSPGKLVGVSPQRSTSGLESYASAAERLDAAGGQRARRFSVPMTVLSDVRGLVESSEIGGDSGQLPTIVRHPFGLGQVHFLAFDPELPPFDRWQGRPALVGRVLQSALGWESQLDEDARRGRLAHLGYEDLTGQLRAALDQFTNVRRVEFSWVAGLIVVYMLLIGPADYFLLKKLQRMHWTWITFPLTVLAFSGLAVLLAWGLSGHRVHINQVDVVDVDVESSVARGTTWQHIYSPSTEAFDLGLVTRWPVPPPVSGAEGRLFGWQGLPGDGLGGLNTTAPASLFPLSYVDRQPPGDLPSPTGEAELIGMPIQVSSSRSLIARWWTELSVPQTQRLAVNNNGLLSGRLANPLDVELSDCMVLYRNWSYPLTGSLRPGQEFTIDGLPPRNLEWRLTRRRVVDSKDVSTPWDQASLDTQRILEILMFHKAAGGKAYTALDHRYQPYLDLSDHLRTGRVILVGRGPEAASSLTRDGRPLDRWTDRQWTIYRIVFPVTTSPADELTADRTGAAPLRGNPLESRS